MISTAAKLTTKCGVSFITPLSLVKMRGEGGLVWAKTSRYRSIFADVQNLGSQLANGYNTTSKLAKSFPDFLKY